MAFQDRIDYPSGSLVPRICGTSRRGSLAGGLPARRWHDLCVRISSDSPLPVDPSLVVPDNGAIDKLKAICDRMSPVLAGSPVLASQARYRPVTQDGLPLIGAVPGARGAYVATGHGVWGILNAPATGEAVAELSLDGAAGTIDLCRLIPRLAALDRDRAVVTRRRHGCQTAARQVAAQQGE